MIRCVSFAGVVTTFAGSQQAGHVDANGESARFSNIGGVSFDRDVGAIICADTNNHRIRKILIRTREASTVAGTGVAELIALQVQFDQLRVSEEAGRRQLLPTLERTIPCAAA